MLRKIAVLLTIPLLFAAACKSTDSDEGSSDSPSSVTDGGSDTSVDTIVDDRAPGITDDTIKVGITYTDFEALGDVVTFNHGDYEAAYNALIDDINDNGGIHGRMLEPIYAPVNPADPTSTDAQCTKLTQDEEVFVAVGVFLADSILCVVDVNETAAIGGDMNAERLALAKAPWFTTELGADGELDAVQTLIDEGQLEGPVAVLYEGAEEATYNDEIAPLLEDGGVDVVEVASIDTGLEAEQVQIAAEPIFQRFEASGAETVLALGRAMPPVSLDALQGSDYQPGIASNNFDGAQSAAADEARDLSVLEGSVAVGRFGPDDAILDLGGVTEECFDVQRDAGITILPESEVPEGGDRQAVSSRIACQHITLLAAILEGAGEDLNYGTFWTAGYSLGEIDIPGSDEPFFYGPPPSADGDQALIVYEFDPETTTYEPVS